MARRHRRSIALATDALLLDRSDVEDSDVISLFLLAECTYISASIGALADTMPVEAIQQADAAVRNAFRTS
jgi:hypothetical protein